MHRVRAKEWVRAYAGDDYPRQPVELNAGDEAMVSDDMLAVLRGTGRVDVIPPLETKPEPAMRRGRPRRDV
jgi:hypothetical protein